MLAMSQLATGLNDHELFQHQDPSFRRSFCRLPSMKQCYCVYPYAHQQVALAKASGCARVICNNALAKSHGFH